MLKNWLTFKRFKYSFQNTKYSSAMSFFKTKSQFKPLLTCFQNKNIASTRKKSHMITYIANKTKHKSTERTDSH